MDHLLFQYCPKIVVVNDGKVLLCRRTGETDYDGTYTFIGGKMEHRDPDIIDALRREKDEEVGPAVTLSVLTTFSVNVEFTKRDGSRMILPHYLADFETGTIELGAEYSEHLWVNAHDLGYVEPIVPNVPTIYYQLQRLLPIAQPADFTRI